MNSLDTQYFKKLMVQNGLDVQIGSIYKYNNSNVNDLRKDHIIRDDNIMSAYCSNKKIIKGYIRNLVKRDMYSILNPDLCLTCMKKYINEHNIKF